MYDKSIITKGGTDIYGAILGDIIGSPYEFHRKVKNKDFKLFIDDSRFTDDTVMTIAVADAILKAKGEGSIDNEKRLKEILIDSLKYWGRRFPNVGYGGRFYNWLLSDNREPYYSYGNGSAMRVSPAGWAADDLETTLKLAGWSAEVTHDHPEGVKGAEATAACIFMARTGSSKDEIKEYIAENYSYDLDRTVEGIRPGYSFDVSCQGSVPESIICFLEGKDYEDTVRNAVFLGGDTDTMGAIAGSISEAYFGVPEYLKEECLSRITPEMREVVTEYME